MGKKNQVAPAPAPHSSSSSEYGSEYETDSDDATSASGSSPSSSASTASAAEPQEARPSSKGKAKVVKVGHAIPDDSFIALSQVQSCERCSQPQTRTRVLSRCVACEQAICGDCNAVSISAFPGSILCLDCLEEHGESLVEVDEYGQVVDSPTSKGGGGGEGEGEGEGETALMTGYTVDGQAVSVPGEVGRLFNELDADDSGSLNKQELGQLARMLGASLSNEDISAAMLEMDPSGDGVVDVIEFSAWWAKQQSGEGGAGVMGSAVANAKGRLVGGLKGLLSGSKVKKGWAQVRTAVVKKEKLSMKMVADSAMSRARAIAFTFRHPVLGVKKLAAAQRAKAELRAAEERRAREESLQAILFADEEDPSDALKALLSGEGEQEAQEAADAALLRPQTPGEDMDEAAALAAAEAADEQVLSLYHVFRQFDKDDSGYIDAKELAKVMVANGEEMTKHEAKGLLEKMDEIEQDGLISFEEFYEVMSRVAVKQGKSIRSTEDAVRALAGVKKEMQEEEAEEQRQLARQRARRRWNQAKDLKRDLLAKNLESASRRAKEQAEAEQRAARAQRRRGRGRGIGGGRGAGRGRAGSAAFAKIEIKAEEMFTYLDEANDDAEVEVPVGDIPKLMETRAIDEDTQIWKAGMTEWMALGEAKLKVGGLLKHVQAGEELRENAEDGGLKGLFAEMDEDGSGALDEGEVGLLLGKLGYELDEKALAKLVAEMDEDGNGEIDFHEFKQWFVGHVSKNAALLEFQQKRQRAHRIAARSGVRHGPVWDVKAAQATQKGKTLAERNGFLVPDEWEKRIDSLMNSTGCGREMAINGLRQVDGHGGKARYVVAQRLNVGPSDLPNATNTDGLASEAEIRFKMQSHFLAELKAKEKTAVSSSAIGTGRLSQAGTLNRIVGRVGLDYEAPTQPGKVQKKPKGRHRRFSVEEMEHEAREKAERQEAAAKAAALRVERNGRGGGRGGSRGRGGRGGTGRGRGRSVGQRLRRASVNLLGAIKATTSSSGTNSPKKSDAPKQSVRQRVRRVSVEAFKIVKEMQAGDSAIVDKA
jgi:Ca2+-binding EF-hand superfamily protein